MTALLAASQAAQSQGGLGVQTRDAWQWIFVVLPVLLGLAVACALIVRARHVAPRESLPARVAVGIEQSTRLPAWVLAGSGVALWGLVVAFIGFVWDVVWHADTGRDKELFTVPHSLIILGLGAIFVASLLAIGLATARRVPVGMRIGRVRVPYSAIPLLLLGLAAMVGFPLDDFWHATYGIDVTMWSPTHLLMIGGASLTPMAVWLMMAEGGVRRHAWGRRLWILMAGLTLVGLSTFQLEYDLGIAQWQELFQPVLIAAAAAIALTMARVSIGPGGAVMAVVVFFAARGPLAVLLSAGLGHALPKFPLYLGEALAVEGAYAVGRLMSAAGVATFAGVLVATLGMAVEWGWMHLWYQYPWQAGLLGYWWMVVVAAVAGALLGHAAGAVLSGRRPQLGSRTVAVAMVALGTMIGLHLPLRTVDGASATIATTPTAAAPVIDTQGLVAQREAVRVTLSPPDAAAGADRFDIVAWQGHAAVEHIELRRVGPGSYAGEDPVPVGGSWKSVLILGHGDALDAAPVALPADPTSNLPAIPAPHSPRTTRFVHAEQLLMREVHNAAEWPFVVILTLFSVAAIAWSVAMAICFGLVSRQQRSTGEKPLLGKRVSPLRAERPALLRR